MGGVVKLPIPAPLHRKAHLIGNLFPKVPYEPPFLTIEVPPLDGMDQIDGAAPMRPKAIVGAILRHSRTEQLGLMRRAPHDTMRKHRNAHALAPPHEGVGEFQHLWMCPLTDGAALLLRIAFRFEKRAIHQRR